MFAKFLNGESMQPSGFPALYSALHLFHTCYIRYNPGKISIPKYLVTDFLVYFHNYISKIISNV